MRAKITIDMDNAAFSGDEAGPELSRILENLANDIYHGFRGSPYELKLRDINGNAVGRVEVE